MGNLRQMFYLSRADSTLDTAAVHGILGISRRNNRQKDITGCLLYSGRHFAQILEGHAAALHDLASRIAEDPRHHGMVVAIDQEVTSRSFPDWSMGMLFKLEVADRIESLLAGEKLPEADVTALFNEIKVDTVMGTL